MTVAVVGLGKLGLPLALLLAEAGFDVLGVDTNPEHLAKLKVGETPWFERHLPEMLAEHGPKIDWRSDPADAGDCDVVFIVVPTPSLPSGAFDVTLVEAVVSSVSQASRYDVSPVLCVVSTTNPGDCARIAENALQPLVYSPEFIALGDVFAGMRRPDLLLIGETDKAAGNAVLSYLRAIRPSRPDGVPPGQHFIPTAPAIHRLTLTEAEIAKLSVNAYVTTKISFANTLGELCAGYGARGSVVARAVGADSRIGVKYLRPGASYGGPCFPRDQQAFAHAGWRKDVETPLSEAADDVNDAQVWRVATLVDHHMPGNFSDEKHGTVAILGTAYKPGTPVTEASFGLLLFDHLDSGPYLVNTYDPVADCTHSSIGTAIRSAIVVVLATDDPAWVRPYPGKVVIDPWGLPIPTEGCTYVSVSG